MNKFSISEINSDTDWEQYVLEHPKGSIFHTPAMFRVFDAAPNYEPMHIAARNHGGKIVALLCAIKISTFGGTFGGLASRSIMYAEPICDDNEEGIEGLTELLNIHDRRWNRKTLFTEVRPIFHESGAEQVAMEKCGYEPSLYCNYVNDLSEGSIALAARTKPIQRKIRAAKRRGLTIEKVSSPESMHCVYKQIQTSYGRSKVPVAPLELFRAMQEHLPTEALCVRLGKVNGTEVAASVGLAFKNRYFAWFNGTTRPAGIAGTASLVWDEIQEACQRGISFYDFGGAGRPDEDFGPRIFKSRFGGSKINTVRYRKIGSPLKLAIANGGYRVMRRFLFNHNNEKPSSELKVKPGLEKSLTL